MCMDIYVRVCIYIYALCFSVPLFLTVLPVLFYLDIARLQSAPIPDLFRLSLPNSTTVFNSVETPNSDACCDRAAGVCCRPCDSRRCGSGSFSERVYVLV